MCIRTNFSLLVMTSIQRIACQRTAVLGRVNSRLPSYLGYSPRLSVLRENDGDEAGKRRGKPCTVYNFVFSTGASLIGYLSCLSRDLDIVGFGIDTAHTLTHAYRLQTDGGGDDLTPLRDPCPSCPPSYNLLSLQDYQLLIPVSGKLYIFTVVNNTPYSQIVVTAACNPISIFKPDRNYFDQDTLFVECRRQSNRNQYFLAKLVKDPNDLQWSYQTLINYDDLTSNGAFQYYIDEFDQYMVYYAYGRGDLLYFEGPDDGYYRFFALPTECAKVVRITRTAKHPQLVIECSSSSNSSVQTINSVFLFDPDFGEFDSLFQGTAYSKCPVRFSDDDSIIAIFTGDSLLVGELSSPSRRVTVENVSSVYDAVLTQVDGNFYAAFTNTSGLYTVNVSQALEGGTVVPLHANDSEDICAHTGCPLLEIIDANTTVVRLNRSIATFSIHPPRLLNSSPISNQPVRFIFHKLHPQATPTAQTATGTTTPSPPPLSLQTSQPIAQPTSTITLAPGETNLPNLIGPKLPIEEGGGSGEKIKFLGFLAIIVLAVIVALVTTVICTVYCKYRGSRRLNG